MGKPKLVQSRTPSAFDLPTFTHPIAFQNFDFSCLKQVDVLAYNGGGLVDSLESLFATLVQRKYALTTNSGTSAIAAMLEGLNLKKGDEVIVPAYTFFATATPLIRLGVTPVLADITESGNVTAATLESCITPRTKAIIVVHLWGVPCDMKPIVDLCIRHDIALLEDASHGHGARIDGNAVGSFGLASAFSLGARKVVTGGQGGIFVTNNRHVLEKGILFAHYNRRGERDVRSEQLRPYAVTGLGYNLRMHPYACALVIPQLAQLQEVIIQRNETASILADRLASLPGVSVPRIPANSIPSWYAFTIRYQAPATGAPSRDELVTKINEAGAGDVDAPGSTCPLLRFAIFRETARASFDAANSVAERYHSQAIKFPTWYGPKRTDYANAYADAVETVFQNLGLA